MSTLEELWNKGKLKPESYPQLIRMLQRERNDRDKMVSAATLAVMQARNQVRAIRQEIEQERRIVESSRH